MQTAATFVSLLALIHLAIAQSFMINTPTGVTSCQPTLFSWVGGSGPFILTLTEGAVTGGAVIKEFDGLSGNSFTWNVDVAGGTSFIANLKDTTGTIAQTAPINVGNGSTSCVNSSITENPSGQTSGPASTGAGSTTTGASSVGTTTSAGATPPATPAPTSSATSPASGGTSSSAKPTTSGSATTGGAAQQSSGAAQPLNAGAVGLTGVMGLLGAMLF